MVAFLLLRVGHNIQRSKTTIDEYTIIDYDAVREFGRLLVDFLVQPHV